MWPLLDVVDVHLGIRGCPASRLTSTGDGPAPPPTSPRAPGGASRACATSPTCSTAPTVSTARACSAPGPAGTTPTATGRSCRTAVRWQAELWRRLRARVGAPSPAERPGGRLPAPSSPAARRRPRPARAPLALRPDAPSGELPRRARGDRRPPRGPPLPAPSLALALGARPPVRAQRVVGAPRRRPQRRHAAQPAARHLGPGRARDAARAGRRARAWTITWPLRRGARPPSRAAPGRGAGRRRRPGRRSTAGSTSACRSTRATGACRSTPVTAGPGRSRCCGTRPHALADDPTLEPRDVLVMCPDIEAFAPLVQATFGSARCPRRRTPSRARRSRVRLADRSLRQTNPVLAVVPSCSTSPTPGSPPPGARPRRPRSRPPPLRVGRRRPGPARPLGAEAGCAGGSTPPTARPTGSRPSRRTPGARASTGCSRGSRWPRRSGRLVGGVLPLDDVDSGSIDLAGRLAEFVERLGAGSTRSPRLGPSRAGRRRCAMPPTRSARSRSGTPGSASSSTASSTTCSTEASAGDADSSLSLTGIRALLADRLRGPPHPGELPHRPPHRLHAGADALGAPPDDLPARPRRRGLPPPRRPRRRRHPRARPAGRRPQRAQRGPPAAARRADGGRRPPGRSPTRARRAHQRRPAARRAHRRAARRHRRHGARRGGSAGTRSSCEHPLQPFDARNFTAGALGRPGPWSFDGPPSRGPARSRRRPAASRAVPHGPLPDPGGDLVSLELLVRFVAHPVRAFLRERLGVSSPARPRAGDEPSRSSSTASSGGRSGSGCCRRGSRRQRPRTRRVGGAGARHPSARPLGPPILGVIEDLARPVGDAAAAPRRRATGARSRSRPPCRRSLPGRDDRGGAATT